MAETQTLARPYAKAAFDHAQQTKTLDTWSDCLSLAAQIVSDADFMTYVSSPDVTRQVQAKQLIVAIGKVSEDQANFLRLVAENGRIAMLPSIHTLFETLKSAGLNQINVVVETAFVLNAKQVKMLGEKLKQRFNAEVNMQSVVNPELIAGVVIRAGNEVIDDSARGKLDKLRTSLMA